MGRIVMQSPIGCEIHIHLLELSRLSYDPKTVAVVL